jgi:hypothetical protein
MYVYVILLERWFNHCSTNIGICAVNDFLCSFKFYFIAEQILRAGGTHVTLLNRL